MYGWQQIHAQDMPAGSAPGGIQPGMPGAPGGAPAAPSPSTEPTMSLSAVVQSGISVSKVKNWDGTFTEFLKFKHKTLDKRVLAVLLPAAYKQDKMTRAGWDTLFQVYDMGYEYRLEAIEKARVPDLSGYTEQFMKEIRGLVPEGAYSGPNPVAGAMESLKMNIPSLWGGSIELPPLLPGMM